MNQLNEGMLISDVGSLNFRPSYAGKVLRSRGTKVILCGRSFAIMCSSKLRCGLITQKEEKDIEDDGSLSPRLACTPCSLLLLATLFLLQVVLVIKQKLKIKND